MATAALTLAAKVDPPLKPPAGGEAGSQLRPQEQDARGRLKRTPSDPVREKATRQRSLEAARARRRTSSAERKEDAPEEDGSLDDKRRVVRLKAQDVRPEPASLAEEDRVDEARHARADLDGPAAGIVEDAVLERPAFGCPDPVHDGAVDEGRPAEEEDAGGEDAASLGGSADQDGGDERRKHVLVAAGEWIIRHVSTCRIPDELAECTLQAMRRAADTWERERAGTYIM